MESRALEYFDAVARTGSVSAAAALVSVTQPAVSKQIARLEAQLGVRLFRRTPRGMMLTAAGKTLHELSADVLTRLERAQSVMQVRHRNRPVFRVACPSSTAHLIVTPFMAQTDAPITDLCIVEAADIDARLDTSADLGVSSMRPPDHRAIVEIGRVPIVLQARSDSDTMASARHGIDIVDLTEVSIVLPRTGVEIAVRSAAVALMPHLQLRVVAAGSVAQAIAARGDAVALVTDTPRFDLQSVPVFAGGHPLAVSLYASWDAEHFASTDIQAVALALREWMQGNAPTFAPGHTDDSVD